MFLTHHHNIVKLSLNFLFIYYYLIRELYIFNSFHFEILRKAKRYVRGAENPQPTIRLRSCELFAVYCDASTPVRTFRVLQPNPCSEEVSVLEGSHELDGGSLHIDGVGLSGLSGDSLGENLLALSLCLSLLSVIFAHSSLEGLTALGSTHVLDSNVDSLGDDSSSVLLVDNDSDGVLSDIEDTTGLTMVELVRHALVD